MKKFYRRDEIYAFCKNAASLQKCAFCFDRRQNPVIFTARNFIFYGERNLNFCGVRFHSKKLRRGILPIKISSVVPPHGENPRGEVLWIERISQITSLRREIIRNMQQRCGISQLTLQRDEILRIRTSWHKISQPASY